MVVQYDCSVYYVYNYVVSWYCLAAAEHKQRQQSAAGDLLPNTLLKGLQRFTWFIILHPYCPLLFSLEHHHVIYEVYNAS